MGILEGDRCVRDDPQRSTKQLDLLIREKDLPVFMMAPSNRLYEKTVSNLTNQISKILLFQIVLI